MKIFITLLTFFLSINVFSQNDKVMIEKIFDTSMNFSNSYQLLDYLSNEIGGRLS